VSDADEKPAEKTKKGDKKAKPPAAQSAPRTIALEQHPRALAAIARLRSTAALGAMAFVALLSHTAGIPLDHCIMRGLVAGSVGYFVGWYVGVTVWRQLIRAELRIAFDKRAAEEAEAS
jgi:hypothetical protein